MRSNDLNRKIDVVARKAKALNIRASKELQRAVTKAGQALQETAEKISANAEELAIRAQHLAKQVSAKPVARKHAR